MSYGYEPAPRRSGMTTAGKWMFIIGLVLSVLTVAVMIWGGMQAVNAARAMENEAVPLTSPQTVSMSANETRFVMAESPEAVSCTVTRPDGTEQALEGMDIPDVAPEGTTLELVGTYTAPSAGEHIFACEGGTAQLSAALGAGALLGAAALGIGFLALLPLGLLTIIGLILWLVGRSRDAKALQSPRHGHGHAYDGPGYGGQGYSGQGYADQGGGDRGPQDTPGWGQQGPSPSGDPYGTDGPRQPRDDDRP